MLKLNQLGFSLVESLIGVSLITGVALMVANVTTKQSSIGSSSSTCRSVLTSLFSSLESGGMSHPVNFFPQAGARSPADGVVSSTWVIDPDIFFDGGAASDILSTGPVPTLRSYKLLNGAVRTINALYNTELYNTHSPYAGLRLDSNGDNAAIRMATELDRTAKSHDAAEGLVPLLKIETYNIDSGQLEAPIVLPLELAPRGNGALSSSPVFTTDPPGFRNNLGFIVSLNLNYDDTQGPCTMSKKYQFDRDTQAPGVPDVVIVSHNSSTGLGVARPSCSAPGVNRVDIDLGYGAVSEPGTQLLCQDLSGTMNWDDASTNPIPHSNNDYGWLSIAAPAFGPGPHGDVNIAGTPNYITSYALNGSDNTFGVKAESDWVACDQLRLCNAPVPSVTENSLSPLNVTLRYNNLPNDCHINFNVMAVDTAGNRSAPVSLTALNPTHNIVANSSATQLCDPAAFTTTLVDDFTNPAPADYYWNRYGPSGTVKSGLITGSHIMATDLSYDNGFAHCDSACPSGANASPFGQLWFRWILTGGSTDHLGACDQLVRCRRNYTHPSIPALNETDGAVNVGYCNGTRPLGGPFTTAINAEPTPRACNTYNWRGWSSCSVTCGGGIQTRNCSYNGAPSGDVAISWCGGNTASPFDAGTAMSDRRNCNTHACVTYAWGAWGACGGGPCGGAGTRNRTCYATPGGAVSDAFCPGSGTGACTMPACPPPPPPPPGGIWSSFTIYSEDTPGDPTFGPCSPLPTTGGACSPVGVTAYCMVSGNPFSWNVRSWDCE